MKPEVDFLMFQTGTAQGDTLLGFLTMGLLLFCLFAYLGLCWFFETYSDRVERWILRRSFQVLTRWAHRINGRNLKRTRVMWPEARDERH